jgi:hypothetical protein
MQTPIRGALFSVVSMPDGLPSATVRTGQILAECRFGGTPDSGFGAGALRLILD